MVVGERARPGLPPGPGLRHGLTVPAESSSSASAVRGPGGQGVNTTDSRVELLFDPAASVALTETQRAGLLRASPTSSSRPDLDRRLRAPVPVAQLVGGPRAARRLAPRGARPTAAVPKATRPTRGSQQRRLAAKKRRSDLVRPRPGAR